MTDTTRITVRSFGFLHDMPADLPPADITIDLRRLLADPAHVPDGSMLDLDGRDPAVRRFVFATPGALDLLDHARRLVQAMDTIKPVVVDFGCAGGRHLPVGRRRLRRVGAAPARPPAPRHQVTPTTARPQRSSHGGCMPDLR